MKAFVVLVLLAAAIAFYFGYEPSDLVTLFQPKPAAVAKHARTTEPAPQTAPQTPTATVVTAPAPGGLLTNRWSPYPGATPQSRSSTAVVPPDGSLENRWSPYPSASPTATVKR